MWSQDFGYLGHLESALIRMNLLRACFYAAAFIINKDEANIDFTLRNEYEIEIIQIPKRSIVLSCFNGECLIKKSYGYGTDGNQFRHLG